MGDGYCLTGVNAPLMLGTCCVCGKACGHFGEYIWPCWPTFGLVWPCSGFRTGTRPNKANKASYAGTKRRNKQIVVFHHLEFTAAAADAVLLSLEPEVPREREAERDRTSHRSLRQTKKVGVDFCQLKTLRMA